MAIVWNVTEERLALTRGYIDPDAQRNVDVTQPAEAALISDGALVVVDAGVDPPAPTTKHVGVDAIVPYANGDPFTLDLSAATAGQAIGVDGRPVSAGGGAPTGPEVGTTLGQTTLVGGNPVIEFSSAWGIDSDGNPYYDDAGASAGESAFLVLATDGTLNLIQPEGVTP